MEISSGKTWAGWRQRKLLQVKKTFKMRVSGKMTYQEPGCVEQGTYQFQLNETSLSRRTVKRWTKRSVMLPIEAAESLSFGISQSLSGPFESSVAPSSSKRVDYKDSQGPYILNQSIKLHLNIISSTNYFHRNISNTKWTLPLLLSTFSISTQLILADIIQSGQQTKILVFPMTILSVD